MTNSGFPAALDAFNNPNAAGGDNLASVPHDLQHGKANDAIVAIQALLGITNSVDTNSHDYKLRHLQGIIAPMAHIAAVSNTITTSGINITLVTNYNALTSLLTLASGLNDANTAQNALGVAYMALAVIVLDLVTKFNTISTGLQTEGLEL